MNNILDFIKNRLNETTKRPFLIAIDGMCGSGKTTLARKISEKTGIPCFHLDDFLDDVFLVHGECVFKVGS